MVTNHFVTFKVQNLNALKNVTKSLLWRKDELNKKCLQSLLQTDKQLKTVINNLKNNYK